MIRVSGLTIYDYKWKGREQVTFSLAKLVTIMNGSFHQRAFFIAFAD